MTKTTLHNINIYFLVFILTIPMFAENLLANASCPKDLDPYFWHDCYLNCENSEDCHVLDLGGRFYFSAKQQANVEKWIPHQKTRVCDPHNELKKNDQRCKPVIAKYGECIKNRCDMPNSCKSKRCIECSAAYKTASNVLRNGYQKLACKSDSECTFIPVTPGDCRCDNGGAIHKNALSKFKKELVAAHQEIRSKCRKDDNSSCECVFEDTKAICRNAQCVASNKFTLDSKDEHLNELYKEDEDDEDGKKPLTFEKLKQFISYGDYQHLLRYYPNNLQERTWVYLKLGLMFAKEGNFTAAIIANNRLLNIDPLKSEAVYNNVCFHTRSESEQKALTWLIYLGKLVEKDAKLKARYRKLLQKDKDLATLQRNRIFAHFAQTYFALPNKLDPNLQTILPNEADLVFQEWKEGLREKIRNYCDPAHSKSTCISPDACAADLTKIINTCEKLTKTTTTAPSLWHLKHNFAACGVIEWQNKLPKSVIGDCTDFGTVFF